MADAPKTQTEHNVHEILREVELLAERPEQLWSEKVRRQLCERARLTGGGTGDTLPGYDGEVDRAIWSAQRKAARNEARETTRRWSLEGLYHTSKRPTYSERWASEVQAEAGSLRTDELLAELDKITAGHRFPLEEEEFDSEEEPNSISEAMHVKKFDVDRFCKLADGVRLHGVIWGKKERLEQLLEDFIYSWHMLVTGGGEWRGLLESIQRYLNTRWLHRPALTIYLFRYSLYGLQLPLLQIASPAKHPTLKRPAVIVSLLGAVAGIGLYWQLGDFFWLVWSLAAAGFAGYVVEVILAERALRRLQPVLREVESGLFDGEEVARRLRAAEGTRLRVPSLLYTLLKVGGPPVSLASSKRAE